MKKQLLIALMAVFALTACKKNDEKPDYILDKTELSLYFDQSYQFTIKQGAQKVSGLKWVSSDETVGTVNAEGLFEAKKIGSTLIKASGNGREVSCRVAVTPYSNLCKEPVLDFGTSKSVIKSKEIRMMEAETNAALIFKGENSKVRNAVYTFENNKLYVAALLLSNTTSVIEESVKFYQERYKYLGSSDGFHIFSDGKKLSIALTYDLTLGYTVLYMESSTVASVSAIKSAYYTEIENIKSDIVK